MENKYTNEFFKQLKEKLNKDINSFFSYKELDRKRLDLLIEVYKDFDVYSEFLNDKLYKSRKITKEDIRKVEDYGKDNNYPSMILVKQNDKITKYLGQGEKAWGEAFAWANLEEPYSSNFLDLLKAIEENNLYGEKK